MINVLYNITLVCTIARKITQSTEEEVCGAGEGVKTRIDSNSGASEFRSFGDKLYKRMWLQL